MKKLIALTIILICTHQVKAQTNNNNATYQYAVLTINRSMGSFDIDVFIDNNQHVDLYKSLNLDTLKLPSNYKEYTYVLTSLNYMDKQGYELVTSSIGGLAQYRPMLREYVFRKKVIAK
jgi:hypothetical protein